MRERWMPFFVVLNMNEHEVDGRNRLMDKLDLMKWGAYMLVLLLI